MSLQEREQNQSESDLTLSGAAYLGSDPLRYVWFNPAQVRFITLASNLKESLTIVEFLKGNGLGGSFSLVALWSAIMFGSRLPIFKTSPFGARWPFEKSARLLTTVASLATTGPIQAAMKQLFPTGRWGQFKGQGKPYYSEGTTDTGWTFDMMTYDQAVLQTASYTKGLILFSEPPPESLFFEAATRLRGRGMVLMDMTQLDEASFNQSLIDEGLKIDGRQVGEVRFTYGHHHESCMDHFKGGHRSHASIEADYGLWLKQGKSYAEARASGKAMALSGRIYPNWGEANVLEKLPEYHQKCWDESRIKIASVLDPHDRKPWAMSWFAIFPNNDVIGFAEWPPFDFWTCDTSPVSDIEDYRTIILETEAEIGRPIDYRIGDPEFLAAPKSGTGKSIKQMLSEPCRSCRDAWEKERDKPRSDFVVYSEAPNPLEVCKHRLNYGGAPNAIPTGHALVRAAIGNANKGERPKLYDLKDACQNSIIGMRRYAWKENKDPRKGLSEKPQLVFKDFPDLRRYLFNAGLDKYPVDPEPEQPSAWARRMRDRNK